jgi:hypothetical protein
VVENPPATLAQAFAAWRGAAESEAAFANDLERVGRDDRPADDQWAS